jgi:Helix-turn-helix domain
MAALVGLARGEWPADPSTLPLFLTEPQLAHLLDKAESTLQRYRREGRSIPFRAVGRQILYDRDGVLRSLRGKSFRSTQEAKLARAG